MEKALVIGASGGIGSAIVDHLNGQGAEVTRLSRSEDGFDLNDPARVDQMLRALNGPYDRIVIATGRLNGAGHPPEKTIRAITPEAMADQFAVNAIGPALVLKHARDLLPRDRRAVIAVLSARVGSIGDNRLGGWISYRAAKAAVNQIVHTSAIELSRTHKQSICVALHPGTVETAFTQGYHPPHDKLSPTASAAYLMSVLDGLEPNQTGGFFDWRGERIQW